MNPERWQWIKTLRPEPPFVFPVRPARVRVPLTRAEARARRLSTRASRRRRARQST